MNARQPFQGGAPDIISMHVKDDFRRGGLVAGRYAGHAQQQDGGGYPDFHQIPSLFSPGVVGYRL